MFWHVTAFLFFLCFLNFRRCWWWWLWYVGLRIQKKKKIFALIKNVQVMINCFLSTQMSGHSLFVLTWFDFIFWVSKLKPRYYDVLRMYVVVIIFLFFKMAELQPQLSTDLIGIMEQRLSAIEHRSAYLQDFINRVMLIPLCFLSEDNFCSCFSDIESYNYETTDPCLPFLSLFFYHKGHHECIYFICFTRGSVFLFVFSK